MEVFGERLEINLTTLQVTRIFKPEAGKKILIIQDLSKKEREKRKVLVLVTAMKKASSEGKTAFIRFSDGELIVNGKCI